MQPNMSQFRIMRQVQQVPFVANQQIQLDIPRNYDINALFVRVYGTIQLTVGATAVKANAPSQLIERIDLFADGNKTFVQTAGIFAAIANSPRRYAQNMTAPLNTVATHTVDVTYFLDRANMDGVRPKDSTLHTQYPYMSLLTLRLTTGEAADCFDMTAGTIGTVSLTIEVFVDETVELNPVDRFEGRFIRRLSYQELTVSAANSAAQIQLPVGSNIRCLRFFQTDGPAAYRDTPVDTLINSIKLRDGVDVRYFLSLKDSVSKNIADAMVNPKTVRPTGVVLADLCPDGHLNQLWDLRAVSQAYCELDVNAPINAGGGKIAVEIEEFMWMDALKPPGAA